MNNDMREKVSGSNQERSVISIYKCNFLMLTLPDSLMQSHFILIN